MKLDYCFHTHTERCGHASGKDEEYVLSAIRNGIKVLGFSDHIMLKNLIQPHTRGSFDKLEDYINSINNLKEKYKDQITILLGFEAEYFDEYHDYYYDLFSKYGFDYLILGQHYLKDEDGRLRYTLSLACRGLIDQYLESVEKAFKTGKILYIAHPDIFVGISETFDEQLVDISHKVCKLCEQYNIPLELNIHGARFEHEDHLLYPNEDFFKIASGYNLQFCFGIDAHSPYEFDDNEYEKVSRIAKKYKLKLLSKKDLLKKVKLIN